MTFLFCSSFKKGLKMDKILFIDKNENVILSRPYNGKYDPKRLRYYSELIDIEWIKNNNNKNKWVPIEVSKLQKIDILY